MGGDTPDLSAIIASSERRVAETRKALMDFTPMAPQPAPEIQQGYPQAPPQQPPQPPQFYLQLQPMQPMQPPHASQGMYQAPQPQPQQQQEPRSFMADDCDFTTLRAMQAMHNLLKGYEARASGIYPEGLKVQVEREIEKLKVYRETLHDIPSEARSLIDTVLSRMIAPFFAPKGEGEKK